MKSWVLVLAALACGIGAVHAAPTKRPPAQAAVGSDWFRVVRMTPAGNFVIGNPAAKVKIVEYMSFTCSHCAHFSNESGTILRGQMIASGSTSLELRPIARDPIDLGATLVARCMGTKDFFGTADAMLASQEAWLPLGINFLNNEAKRFAQATPLEQVRAGAQSTGLIDLARARGLTSARLNQCFANKAGLAQALKTRDEAGKVISGTPSFFVNGQKADASSWGQLEPILRAKGA